jgi:hypothetical protein
LCLVPLARIQLLHLVHNAPAEGVVAGLKLKSRPEFWVYRQMATTGDYDRRVKARTIWHCRP